MNKLLLVLVLGLFSVVTTAHAGLEKAPGKYILDKKADASECLSPNYNVKFYPKKKAILGRECGAVLWAASSTDPMGLFFCQADSKLQSKKIGVPVASDTANFFMRDAGQADSSTVQFVLLAKDNDEDLMEEGTKSVKEVLKVTKTGIELIEVVTMDDGKVTTRTCAYNRKK